MQQNNAKMNIRVFTTGRITLLSPIYLSEYQCQLQELKISNFPNTVVTWELEKIGNDKTRLKNCHTQDCSITVTILQRLRLLADVIFVPLIILLLASRSMHKSSSIKENRFGALLSVNDVEYVTVRVLVTVINPKVLKEKNTYQ